MSYQKLGYFQNDEIIKDDIIKKFDYMEMVMVEIHQNLDEKDLEIKNIMYQNLADIKASLKGEGLNLSLLYNRICIIYDAIVLKFDTSSNETLFRQADSFLDLKEYIGNILNHSGIDIKTLYTQQEFGNRLGTIIYSK